MHDWNVASLVIPSLSEANGEESFRAFKVKLVFAVP